MLPIESLDFRNLERYCALNASFIVPMRPPPEGFGDSDALQRERSWLTIYPEFQTMHPNQLSHDTKTIMIFLALKWLLIVI